MNWARVFVFALVPVLAPVVVLGLIAGLLWGAVGAGLIFASSIIDDALAEGDLP